MKHVKVIPMLAASVMLIASCSKDSPSPETPVAPVATLSIAEKINLYEPLKNYTSLKMGVGIDADLYLNNASYRKLINDNFDELTCGYSMKHAALVKSDGTVDFSYMDSFLTQTKAAGITIFGHTLCWHSNQNAAYLNGLIAPGVVAGTSGPNVVKNGDFETGGVSAWSQYNGAANSFSLVGAADANSGSGAMKITNAFTDANVPWATQIHTDFSAALVAGQVYTLSFMIRSDAAGAFRCSTSGTTPHYQSTQTTSSSWQQIKWVLTADGGEAGFNFDIGSVPGNYYIDNISMSSAGSTTGGIAKTDAEKTQIITASLTDFISKTVTHFKGNVTAWDVVNEEMNEDGTPQDGTETGGVTTQSDFFSWAKYMGKDFAVTAFKLAVQYGNPTDKLFINDYNLEYSLPKCDGIVAYVKYLESKGARVDGIGTQMHISINSDTGKITQMFQKLAASGKLIHVSELDVKIGSSTPTAEQLTQQANMYKFVVDSYIANVPLSQRYGITIWGLSDNPGEHKSWIPNDGPNLWDANYVRKLAYKYVADGLAGKDVSAGF